MTKTQGVALSGLMVLAFGLRVWGADEVAPYVPDTQIIREAMDLGQKLATGSAIFDVGLGDTDKYPLVLPYLILAIYGTIFEVGRLLGTFHSLQDFVGWLFINRIQMHVVAVSFISLLSTLTVPLAFFIARRFEAHIAPWVAAIGVTFSLLLIQFSHHARPHVALAFFILLTLYFSIRIYETGSLWAYIAAGGSAALAGGTLQNGMLVILPLIVAHLLRMDWRDFTSIVKTAINRQSLIAMAVLGLGLLLAYPQIVFRSHGVVSVVTASNGQPALLFGGQTGFAMDGFQLKYLPQNIGALLGNEPILATLGLIGLIYYCFRPEHRAEHLILASFGIVFSLIFGLLSFTLPHYFSPLVAVLAIVAGHLLTDLNRICALKLPRIAPALTIGVGGFLLLSSVVYAFRLDYLLGQSDTRSQARDWILDNLQAGSEVASDFRLEMYPTQASILRQENEMPDTLGTREQWLSQLPQTAYPAPAFALTQLDVYPIKEMTALDTLMTKHQIQYLVFEQPAEQSRQNSLVYDYALSQGTRVAVFCPHHPTDPWLAYTLPDDIPAPWVELWQVDSPGPLVQIFSMQPSPVQQPRLSVC